VLVYLTFVELNPHEEQSGAVRLRYDHQELDYRSYGFTEEDLNKEFFINPDHLTVSLGDKN
jgi:2-oxoglutarate dehydrogenase complex, dehydrogenase (E1) component, and related enzymes